MDEYRDCLNEPDEVLDEPDDTSDEPDGVLDEPDDMSDELDEVLDEPDDTSDELDGVLDEPDDMSDELAEVLDEPDDMSDELAEVLDEPDDMSDEPPDGDFGRLREFHAICGRIARRSGEKPENSASACAKSAFAGWHGVCGSNPGIGLRLNKNWQAGVRFVSCAES